MLEPEFYTKWDCPIFLKIENGAFICNNLFESETLFFESVSGRLNNIYADYMSFKSGKFKYWHIELIDNSNTYVVCFPYTSAMFLSVILKLATARNYENIRFSPYKDGVPYQRRCHSKIRVFSDENELYALPYKLPKIDCYKFGTRVRKDYTQRIAVIEDVVNRIMQKVQNTSTRACKEAL